ncbi:MAG: protein kinase domain-containing protein [Bryobacteraceae bacterium]
MAQFWKQWEGQLIARTFPLRQYLGGADGHGVFLTEFIDDESRRAAIKLVPEDPEIADLQLARWKQAAQLSHPNLLRVFDSGRCRLGDTALLYVVEEFADENLSQVLPERSLTAVEAREMLAPVVNALGYLHANGFVHGHLKPANIMATGDTVKVSTDGVRPIGEAVGEPEPGAFDAPEIAHGQSTPAGDVWSLGVTLVEVLTQRFPDWKPASHTDPVLPETLPGPFAEVASDCLRLDPQLRPTLTEVVARVYGPMQKPRAMGPSVPRVGYAPWVAAAVLLLAAVFIGHKMLTRPDAAHSPAPAAGQNENATATPPAQVPTPISPAPSVSRPEPVPADGASAQEIVHRVMPDVSKQALHTIRGRVRVRVRLRVDPHGTVANASLDFAGPSRYFANAALRAAQGWVFAPAGSNIERAWILHFVFRQSGATIEPVPVKP